MTEMEQLARAAIAKTLAACTQAGDARKAEAYASCFTEDGVLDLGGRLVGRDAIRQWMSAPSVIPQPGGGKPGYVSHHLTTCRIDLTSDRSATVRTYWLVISAVGVDHSGYYDDRLVASGDEWLIAYRRPRTLWVAPTSLIAGAH
ncbi:nuclear transport factor 2 family protein [Phenylobacterium sp. LjRoot225]|uniref:nuclear transport factor 2 family protein n=1 Tax=Phenylobacterium sp. LjRoot225 TaxID=3342285 RepID=UPI003ECF8628